MIKQLINYKFSELSNLDTSGLTEQKSQCFRETYYVFNNGKLMYVADTTIANDSHALASRLVKNEYADKSELEMYDCE